MKLRPDRHGLVLLELLTAMAIVAILAGILLPALMASRVAGRETACMNRARQIGFSAVMYSEDYEDRYPPVEEWRGSDIYTRLAPYMAYRSRSCFHEVSCPNVRWAGRSYPWPILMRYQITEPDPAFRQAYGLQHWDAIDTYHHDFQAHPHDFGCICIEGGTLLPYRARPRSWSRISSYESRGSESKA